MSAVEKPLFSTGFASLVRPTVPSEHGKPNLLTLPFRLSYRVRIPEINLPADKFHGALGVCSWLVHLRTRTSNRVARRVFPEDLIQPRGSTPCPKQPSSLLHRSASA